MAELAYFFDSTIKNGQPDRPYTSADFAQLFQAAFSNGVVPAYGETLKVTAGTKGGTLPEISVAPGAALINGYMYVNTTTWKKTLAAQNDSQQRNRIDRVILKLDVANRKLQLDVLTGTPATSPKPPALPTGSGVLCLVLAEALVEPGKNTVTTLTDKRSSNLCGWSGVRLKDADLSGLVNSWSEQLDSLVNADDTVIDTDDPTVNKKASAVLAQVQTNLRTMREEISQYAQTIADQNEVVMSGAHIDLLWRADTATLADGAAFQPQSLLSRSTLDAYTLILVIFRKSSGTQDLLKKISKPKDNLTGDAWAKNNQDRGNLSHCFLRKGEGTMVTYFPHLVGSALMATGLSRPVWWLTNNMTYNYIYNFDGAIAFGDALAAKNGGKATQKLSKGKYVDVPANVVHNTDFNQLMIPVAIYGFASIADKTNNT